MPAGQANTFVCSRCRSRPRHEKRGGVDDVMLLARMRKPRASLKASEYFTLTEYDYHCLVCGHMGWSRHVEIATKADREEISPHPTDAAGQTRYDHTQRVLQRKRELKQSGRQGSNLRLPDPKSGTLPD